MQLLNYLQATPYAYYLLMAAIGLLVGSFLNVVIHRLPIMLQRNWEKECRLILEINYDQPQEPEPYNLFPAALPMPPLQSNDQGS